MRQTEAEFWTSAGGLEGVVQQNLAPGEFLSPNDGNHEDSASGIIFPATLPPCTEFPRIQLVLE
jgi:hypothetical protein